MTSTALHWLSRLIIAALVLSTLWLVFLAQSTQDQATAAARLAQTAPVEPAPSETPSPAPQSQ